MHDIIKRSIVTEKNTLQAGMLNEYGFEVALTANRTEIKKAVEKLFNVSVVRVNTMVCRRQPRRLGKKAGSRKLFKKAIVKLKDGDKFDFVAG